MQKNSCNNNDDEYVDLQEMINNLPEGSTILALSETDIHNEWFLILGQKEGYFQWEINTKSLVTLKNLIEIYNENKIIIDIYTDGVKFLENDYGEYIFTLEINNKELPITSDEKNEILNMINAKLNDN